MNPFSAALLITGSLLFQTTHAEETRAFVGARLIPVGSEAIDDGVLVIRDGKISAIGPTATTNIPTGAEVVDVSGKVLMPGLVCTHSHIGEVSGADSSGPIQPDVRALDSINVRHSSFERARAGGLTLVNIMPGSGHLLSGQTTYLKLRDGNSVEELAVRREDGAMAGGIKMANGTNSIRDKGPFPGTRGKAVALVREQFLKAQAYRTKNAKADEDEEEDKEPSRDLAMETLVEVLEGRRVVHHHTHRHDDILTVLRLKKEFGFKVVLHHVSEAWKVADEIAEADVAVSLIVLDSPGGKPEAVDIDWRNGAEMEQRGILTALHTDDPINDSRWFLRSAALAVRGGMSRDKALEAVTLAGARMLDLDQQTGSLAVGKDADFIILSGDPLSIYTRVQETWVDGKQVFDLTNPEDALYAEGGFGAGEVRAATGCCFSR